ncbi:MAG: macro domain-containing protein [Planctomycetota bacterium]
MQREQHFEHRLTSDVTIRVIRGDLTQEEVDAIVNAANEHLAHGGGVAGAIARAGGPVIQRESDEWTREHGPVPTGSAAITSGGELPAKHVIHAVGPIWGCGAEDDKLKSAITASLDLAQEHRLKSVAFPAISSGIFGFPKDRCARVFCETLNEYFGEDRGALQEVILCLFDEETTGLFVEAAQEQWGIE